jgi:hypothetical protein
MAKKVNNYKDISIGKTYSLTLTKTNNKNWNNCSIGKMGESANVVGGSYLVLVNNRSAEEMTLFSKNYNRSWYLEEI